MSSFLKPKAKKSNVVKPKPKPKPKKPAKKPAKKPKAKRKTTVKKPKGVKATVTEKTDAKATNTHINITIDNKKPPSQPRTTAVKKTVTTAPAQIIQRPVQTNNFAKELKELKEQNEKILKQALDKKKETAEFGTNTYDELIEGLAQNEIDINNAANVVGHHQLIATPSDEAANQPGGAADLGQGGDGGGGGVQLNPDDTPKKGQSVSIGGFLYSKPTLFNALFPKTEYNSNLNAALIGKKHGQQLRMEKKGSKWILNDTVWANIHDFLSDNGKEVLPYAEDN